MLGLTLGIAMLFLFVALLFTMFMFFRNEWVYKERMKILHGKNGLYEHEKMPDYDTML